MLKYVLSILALSFVLTGCNTFAGFGKDVERGGEKLQETSHKVQQ